MRGLIRALAIVITSDPAIFQPFDPLGGVEDSITNGDVEVRHSPIILDIAVGRSIECVLIVLDTIVEPVDLLFESTDFTGFIGFTLSDG